MSLQPEVMDNPVESPSAGRMCLQPEIVNNPASVKPHQSMPLQRGVGGTLAESSSPDVSLQPEVVGNPCHVNYRIDATAEDESFGRLINDEHIIPNAVSKPLHIDGEVHVAFFAKRNIQPGEEITYNYCPSSHYRWRGAKVRKVVQNSLVVDLTVTKLYILAVRSNYNIGDPADFFFTANNIAYHEKSVKSQKVQACLTL